MPGTALCTLDPGIGDFSNRIRKNQQAHRALGATPRVTCYRVYDADLPDYAFAVDLYRGSDATWLHVQEYAPPAGIDAAKAQLRRDSVEAVLPELFGVDAAHVVMKTRERKRGSRAVRPAGLGRRVPRSDRRRLHAAREPARLPRHGSVSSTIGRCACAFSAKARGKRFLNLYSYTGAATVHALRGGASQQRVGRPVEHLSELGAAQSRTERARSASITG